MPEAPQKLDMPAGAKPAEIEELTIHVMPPEFRGGKSPMIAPAAPSAPPVPPPVTPVPPKKVIVPPTGKAPVVKKRLVSPIVLVAGGLFFLAVIGLGAYLLLSVEPAQEIVVEETEETNGTEVTEDIEEIVEEEGEEEPVEVEPVPGTDSDSDGLTNIEEILFGSDPKNPDTDADTYLDGNEVYHLYNPRGDFSANLTDAGFAREFSAGDVSYAIIYPSRWTVQMDEETFVAKAPTGETVRVELVDVDPALELKAWYRDQHPDTAVDELSDVLSKQGYTGITSPDKRTTYLDVGEVVYAISYDLADNEEINFLTTYQMMVNSFLAAAE